MKDAASVVVDRMADNDAEPLFRLFAHILEALPYYNETAKKSELQKYSPLLLRQATLREPDSVLTARVGSELVGFCFSEDDDGLVWLAWFGVHPSFRRRGVGSGLLRSLEERVRNGRSHKIWCDCRTENQVSQAALIRQGYSMLCTVPNHWYGQDFILWEKLVA
jgi:ribosomal protein S18 acetylase RimI-like enzyme